MHRWFWMPWIGSVVCQSNNRLSVIHREGQGTSEITTPKHRLLTSVLVDLVEETQLAMLKEEESSSFTPKPSRAPRTNPPTHTPVRTDKPTLANRRTNSPSEAPTVLTSSPSIRVTSMDPTKPPPIISTSPPTPSPISKPTSRQSGRPSGRPSRRPSRTPSRTPSRRPSRTPSHKPSHRPSHKPSLRPSHKPSLRPSHKPSLRPSRGPSSSGPSPVRPTNNPSTAPSRSPSSIPSTTKPVFIFPTTQPTLLPNLLGIIRNTQNLSSLANMIYFAGLDQVFLQPGPMTVFATGKVGFNDELGSEYMDVLLQEPEFGIHLSNLVLTQVTPNGGFLVSDFFDGQRLTMGSSEPLTVYVSSNGTVELETFAAREGYTTRVPLVATDALATNGVLHQIPRALAPFWSLTDPTTVLGYLNNTFSTFLELIITADLENLYSKANRSTVVAANNAAWNALSTEYLNFLKSPEGSRDLEGILSYNHIPQVLNVFNLPDGDNQFPTSQGEMIGFTIEGSDSEANLYINDVEIFTLYLSRWSIIYESDLVLIPSDVNPNVPTPAPTRAPTLPPQFNASIYEYISEETDLAILTEALEKTGAAGALADRMSGPYTIFAANDQDFASVLGEGYLANLFSNDYDLHLRSLTFYHIANSALLASQLRDQLLIQMANSLSVRVIRDGSLLQLSTSSVLLDRTPPINVTGDQAFTINGVLHKVDTPILPFWYFLNPISALDGMQSFSTLLSLITVAELEDVITDLVNSTIAAPNNAAFNSLSPTTLEFLLNPNNNEVTAQVVKYHIIVELLPFTKLDFGEFQAATLLDNQTVTVSVVESSSGGKRLRFNGIPGVGVGYFLAKEDLLYEIGGVVIPPNLGSTFLVQYEDKGLSAKETKQQHSPGSV